MFGSSETTSTPILYVLDSTFACHWTRWGRRPLAGIDRARGGIVAKFFAWIFYRNCIAIGFSIIECDEAFDRIDEGDELKLDLQRARDE